MLTSEEVREIELRVAADYACLDAPGFRDSLAARRDVAALLEDRAEMQAEIERLRVVVEAAREVEKHLNSDVIFEEMREVWGNTNTYIWRRAIKANGAALKALEADRD